MEGIIASDCSPLAKLMEGDGAECRRSKSLRHAALVSQRNLPIITSPIFCAQEIAAGPEMLLINDMLCKSQADSSSACIVCRIAAQALCLDCSEQLFVGEEQLGRYFSAQSLVAVFQEVLFQAR